MVRKEILAVLKANKKGAKSLKPERPHLSKLVCMHVTSTPTCMNFLSQFYSIKTWPKIKVEISLKLEKPRIPKLLCMHVTSIPICMSRFYFLNPVDYSYGNFGHFEGKAKGRKYPKLERP